jgi:hypothetical protein
MRDKRSIIPFLASTFFTTECMWDVWFLASAVNESSLLWDFTVCEIPENQRCLVGCVVPMSALAVR